MTKIVVTSTKPVLTHMGKLPKGIPQDVPEQLAKFLIEQGVAVLFETKEKMDRPTVAAGTEELSSALPVAPAYTEMTLTVSEPGAKRRGRPKKEA